MKTKLLFPLLSLTLGALPLLAELKYFPKDKAELLELVKNEKIKLDEIDTSKIKDMSYMFNGANAWNHSVRKMWNLEGKNVRGLIGGTALYKRLYGDK